MMLNKTSAENEAAALRIQKMKEEGEFRSTLGNRAESVVANQNNVGRGAINANVKIKKTKLRNLRLSDRLV